MRVRQVVFDIAVLLLLGVGAAVLQDSLPPLRWGGLKPPLLLGVALYYAVYRPLPLAIPAGLWCGMLMDGLGSLPPGLALLEVGAVLAFCALWVRRQLPESGLTCALLGVVAAFLMNAVEYLALLLGGGQLALSVAQALLRGLGAALLSGVTCAVVAALAHALDKFALNIKTENNADGFDWSGDRA